MTVLYPQLLWLMLPFVPLFLRTKRFSNKIHLLVVLLLILSLSRPVLESRLQETDIAAKDIVILLDVSYSMQAADIQPTRYGYAKAVINALLKDNPADNVMLIAFTTNPLLLTPPTTDHRLVSIALESLNPAYILTKGTSLETLFKKLTSLGVSRKQLLLITDGGEEDDLAALTTALQETGASLTLLALGTTAGTTVTKEDGSYLKDSEGNLVISRINPLLEPLASSVDGTYIEADDSAASTAKKLSDALQAEHTDRQNVRKMQYTYLELYQIPLALAILLFLMLHTRAVKYLILLFTLFGLQAQASVLDVYELNRAYDSYAQHDYNTTLHRLSKIQHPSLQSQIALAHTYYRQGAFKKAIAVYTAIRSTSPQIKQQLYYNIANAYAMQKAYSKATVYYTKALQLGDDEEAKKNLALVVLLQDKTDAKLGIAHPKGQDTSASKSESQKDNDSARDEDSPSSGSGAGAESKTNSDKVQDRLMDDNSKEEHPLSSKVYELINKGYIRETHPW